MIGGNPGKAPQTDAQWAREISQRLAQLESATTVRIGKWVVSSVDGALTATAPGEQPQNLGSPSSIDESAVEGIIRSAGYATTEQVAEQVTPLQEQVAQQGSSITDIFEDLTDLFTNAGQQQTQIESVIARLDEIDATFGTTPAYVADQGDMATAMRSGLVTERYSGASVQETGHRHGISNPGTSTQTDLAGTHNHTINLTRFYDVPFYTPDTATGNSTALVDYTPIVVDREGVIRALRWVCGVGGIFDVDAYYMAICAYNPNNGNIEKVWDSGNIADDTDYSSPLEIEWELDDPQPCAPGQVLFMAHQQIAPGTAQSARPFACVPQGGIGRPATLLLDACTYRSPARYGSIPSSISKSSLTKINTRIPWIAAAVAVE
ncbi:minor tail protein [Gordonia phage BiggityBass]|nr:minor tail protein [Gordonia phage BiggityBass]